LGGRKLEGLPFHMV